MVWWLSVPNTSTWIMVKIVYVPLSDLQLREAVLKFAHIEYFLCIYGYKLKTSGVFW